MVRPRYETEEDRANERIVKDIIKEAHDYCSLEKGSNAHYSTIDYFGYHSGDLIGLFEIKCRTFRWGDYPTVMFSAGKWRDGATAAKFLDVPFYIVISTYSGTYQYKQSLEDRRSRKITCEFGGRTDATRDKGDIEPVMMIPIELFTKISDEGAFTKFEPQ